MIDSRGEMIGHLSERHIVARDIAAGRSVLHASINCVHPFADRDATITVRIATGSSGDIYSMFSPRRRFGADNNVGESSGGTGWGRYRRCLSLEQPFVALDFETTGLKAHRHKVIEIAAIRMVPGKGTAAYYHRLVRHPRKLSAKVVSLTGIDDTLLESEGVDACTALTGLVEFIGSDPIVAYNAPFDLGFLNAGCVQHSLSVAMRGGHSCALSLARRVWPGMSSYRLCDISAWLGLNMDGQHRALGDARRAAQVYRIASADFATK